MKDILSKFVEWLELPNCLKVLPYYFKYIDPNSCIKIACQKYCKMPVVVTAAPVIKNALEKGQKKGGPWSHRLTVTVSREKRSSSADGADRRISFRNLESKLRAPPGKRLLVV
ncbi:hypothetical protein AVEN_139225-1 [Araneus ventricosus]|uniref:Uncharacterized protein n=1 Tax=Araneus ventricosus TaxID=182803 RepID=A0A4Y2G0J6_ARAVE|nr:hypothetical protein AVEN_139225-1 [Araneus ventricosus]